MTPHHTHTLDSIWEQTGQDCNSTRRHSRFGLQTVETASQFHVMMSKHSKDDVKIHIDDVKLTDSGEARRRFTGTLPRRVVKLQFAITRTSVAKKEVELGREELIDLLGFNVVKNMYKAKVKYDKYCDKMLNRRALGKITNCDFLSRGKDLITLKVYRKDGSDEIIQNFKANDMHLSE
ncbi:hypothetical protein Tco_0844843 [Tanacetum coccineum]